MKFASMYYVYIIHSPARNLFYKGYTADVKLRLSQHNQNQSQYTSNKGPWELFVVERYETKRSALHREKSLKGCKREYFLWLSQQASNIVDDFR